MVSEEENSANPCPDVSYNNVRTGLHPGNATFPRPTGFEFSRHVQPTPSRAIDFQFKAEGERRLGCMGHSAGLVNLLYISLGFVFTRGPTQERYKRRSIFKQRAKKGAERRKKVARGAQPKREKQVALDEIGSVTFSSRRHYGTEITFWLVSFWALELDYITRITFAFLKLSD
jgi:hypothetical protein